MKRIVVITIILLVSSVAFAGEPFEPNRDAAAFLQLNASQQAAWDAAKTEYRTAVEPLFVRAEQLGRDAETALKNKADACTLGNAMLAHQAVHDQIRAQREVMQQKIEAVLTPDQKTKYEAFKAAQRTEGFERQRRKVERE